MAFVLSSVSGNLISAASAGYAPTNSVDVSAIASAYQVVSSIGVAAGALSSINGYGLSAGIANSAGTAMVWLGATGKLDNSAANDFYTTGNESGFVDSAYVESHVSGKLDSTAFNSGDFYSTSNPSGFITGIDLSPYQKSADMTAYQPVGNYYSASNPSGFVDSAYVTGAITGKQDTLAFGYNTANQISSIDGSALGGGGAVEQVVTSTGSAQAASGWFQIVTISSINGSAILPLGYSALSANSANWNSTRNVVTANSASWNSAYSLISGVTALMDAI